MKSITVPIKHKLAIKKNFGFKVITKEYMFLWARKVYLGEGTGIKNGFDVCEKVSYSEVVEKRYVD